MGRLILLRHGESMWNRKNLFTGWVDVPLSPKGIEEAQAAGRALAEMPIDVVFCSSLVRAIMTAMIALAAHSSGKTPIILHPEGRMREWGAIASPTVQEEMIPVHCNEALNERMYGELQGLNKRETMDRFGEEQVRIWRRSYAVTPPQGESLALTSDRALPYFDATIVPLLNQGKNILISAHGNSLRAIIKKLDGLSEEEILSLELATGHPIIYTWGDTPQRLAEGAK